MPIPDSFLDELVGRTDITELVSGYVRLTKKSGSNMFGLCPFHSEKSPSFSVNADKQIYHCFGCGKGGGAINFIMEIENLSFRDAIELLASRAGLTVPDNDMPDELLSRRRRMLEINRDAARFFHDMLSAPEGRTAREYLARRGISKAMVTRFGLGAAPDSWSALLDAMVAKGYGRHELIEAGLAKKSQKGTGVYDLFRNRLIFPVIDVRGGVIGFSGRILDDGEPKYLNSPDTLVFNKSRNLFALNLAKKTKSGMLILAEGNIDVVSLHQAGFDCAVASLGTALTGEQIRLMSRYTENVVIAYDSDGAGQKAAMRAIGMFEKTGIDVRVLEMGEAKDPDEYLKKHGADSFKLLLERSGNHIEFRLADIKRKAELDTDDGRLKYLAAATELLAELGSAAEREIYGARVAETAGVSAQSVENEVKKLIRIKKAKQKKRFETQVTRPAASIQPEDRSLRYKNEYSAAAEEGVIRCLMTEPVLLRAMEEIGFKAEEFTSLFLKKVYEIVVRRCSAGLDASAALVSAELETNEASQLSVILQKPETTPNGEKAIRDYIEKIRTEKYKTGDPGDFETLLAYKKYREMKDVGG